MLSPAEYTLVSTTTYNAPPRPDAFTVPRNINAAEAVWRREARQEKIRKFRESLDINKALIRQIVVAVDGQYIDELRSPTTNTIDKSIPKILKHLIDNFSDVTTHDVLQEEK